MDRGHQLKSTMYFVLGVMEKKLIYNDTPETWEFYDLDNDPCESDNIYDESLIDVKKLKTRLLDYLHENKINTKLTQEI